MSVKIIQRVTKYLERVMTAPGQELSNWAKFIRFQIQLWRFCARRLWENNVMAMSAALSFRTIFALIPILVLGFLLMKSFGALEASEQRLHEFLVSSGLEQITVRQQVTEAAEGVGTGRSARGAEAKVINVADEIEELVTRIESKLTVGRLGPVGAALLIWSAMALVGTIERSLNRIFGVPQGRGLARRILLYWAVVTLGPLLLAGASYAGQELANLSAKTPILSWLLAGVGWTGPIIVGVLMVGALYKLMPNTHVRLRSAASGALVAVSLWLVAKWAFAIYIRELVGTGSLYGSLGLVPLSLVWLNCSWWIFLFGAELAHTAVNLDRIQSAHQAERIVLGPSDLLAAAIAVARLYSAGCGPVTIDELATKLNLPDESIDRLIDRLTRSGVVCPVSERPDASFVLARPAEKISVLRVLEMDGLPADQSDLSASRASRRYADEIADKVVQVQQRAGAALGQLTLAEFIDAE